MSGNWILLRGLARGNGHWGTFPKLLKRAGVEIELHEIPGNGTLHQLETPTEVSEVIDHLRNSSQFVKNKSKVSICGLSLGGMVALKWAEAFPDEIKSVAVVNSSLKDHSQFHERMLPSNYLKIIAALLIPDSFIQERIILSIISNRPEKIKENLENFIEFSKEHPVSKNNFFRQLILASSIQVGKLPKSKVKIIGSNQDRLVNPSCTLKLAEYLDVKPLIHRDAGHDLPLDEPEWLIESLLK